MNKMGINVNYFARTIDVDNRIPLRNYYRIADNLLRQANIYREEKNVVDLHIILIRYSSLISETIPRHKDYQRLNPKEKAAYKKRLFPVLDELESLKPEFDRQVDKLNKSRARVQQAELNIPERIGHGSGTSSLDQTSASAKYSSNSDIKQSANTSIHSSWNDDGNNNTRATSHSFQIDKQFQNLNISMPLPKNETLSRHSFLGPSGLRGQWQGPSTPIKVQYPSNKELTSTAESRNGLTQAGQHDILPIRVTEPVGAGSAMESVLSLDDGRWSRPAVDLCSLLSNEAREDPFQFVSIRQPSPPPVLAQVRQDFSPIHPSQVADPRPGPLQPCVDGTTSPNSYQHLHIPVNMMDDFLRLARANTGKNLETCGVLAGSLKNRIFHITTLIIPKQESTSDSCQTLNEEEIFEVQDQLSLFQLGWIHTHPSQTCFMSSVDLHTHYSYQVMLPEAVAIVMAPTDEKSPHGIFHLSDPGGVSLIRNCQQRGFHSHEEPSDGSPIYEHCSHVYMNAKMKFEVIDLR